MSKDTGFTLVELLVVLAVIATLIGLLLPAVQAAREAARKMSCSNKIRQLGLSVHSFESAHKSFPAAWAVDKGLGSWVVPLLPGLELQAAFNQYQNWGGLDSTGPRYDKPENRIVTELMFPIFGCPSDEVADFRGISLFNYAINIGNTNNSQKSIGDEPFRGAPFKPSRKLFEQKSGLGFKSIKDGSSNTVLFAEVLVGKGGADLRGLAWGGSTFSGYIGPNSSCADTVYNPAFCNSINGMPCVSPVPQDCGARGVHGSRSRHTGGVNICLVDGSTQFVSDGIDLSTWRALITAKGAEVFAW